MKWKKKQWNSWHWLEPSLESLQRIHVNDHVVNYPFDSFESYLVLHLIMVILDFTYVRIVHNLLMNILHSSQVPDSSVYFHQSSFSSSNKPNFLLYGNSWWHVFLYMSKYDIDTSFFEKLLKSLKSMFPLKHTFFG